VFDRARETGGLREHERDVLFIDASRDFQPGKRQNQLRDEDIQRIVETYRERRAIERYSHLATLEEIEGNGFNLNIPRYVDTYEPEAEIDLQAVQDEIEALEKQLVETRKQMNGYLKELGIHVGG
jgi:type I restriction enzyme M protein